MLYVCRKRKETRAENKVFILSLDQIYHTTAATERSDLIFLLNFFSSVYIFLRCKRILPSTWL